MPTLYYTPTSCGAASFIAAHTANLPFACEEVALSTHTIVRTGEDFYKVNPKGNVPALVLDDGTLLNEGAAVLQAIADMKPEAGLAPEPKTSARYLVQGALNWVASELHAASGPLFGPASDEVKAYNLGRLNKKYEMLDKMLDGKNFLVGDSFTVADSYCYIVTTWAGYIGVDLSMYPNVKSYQERCAALPNVKAAHARMAEKPTTVV